MMLNHVNAGGNAGERFPTIHLPKIMVQIQKPTDSFPWAFFIYCRSPARSAVTSQTGATG
jgi:hypothetical protein